MQILIKIGLRNLIRQKRRNILLGSAMAFGIMVLVLSVSFSHGLSDILFNKIVVWISGHIGVQVSQGGNQNKQVFHDKDRIVNTIKKEIKGLNYIQENLSFPARAIGNSVSDNVVMVGVDMRRSLNPQMTKEERKAIEDESDESFHMIVGQFKDLLDSSVTNPVIISKEKSDLLHVVKGDVLRVRYTDLNGQFQVVQLTVVGIFKPLADAMSTPVFVEVSDLRRFVGFGKNDVGSLYIRIKDAKENASKEADKLHDAMKAKTACIYGTLANGNRNSNIITLGFKNDTNSINILRNKFKLKKQTTERAFLRNGIYLMDSVAMLLKVNEGDTCKLSYTSKDNLVVGTTFVVDGILENNTEALGNILFVNEKQFYKSYYSNWPVPPPDSISKSILSELGPILKAIDPEWLLLERFHTADEVKKQMQDIKNSDYSGTVVNIQSMYEIASDIVSMESVINLLTVIAVLVLFSIVMVGVVNSLHMNIRERTREIGTIRAIGMKRGDVKKIVIIETTILSIISSITGTVIALIVMILLSQIKFKFEANPMTMFMINKQLHFLPTVGSVAFCIVFVILLGAITAYFPAKKAAKMKPADALRHFE